jgi:hypothetical protein
MRRIATSLLIILTACSCQTTPKINTVKMPDEVRWQIWMGLLIHLLMRCLAFMHSWSHSFTRLFTVVHAVLWRRWNLFALLKSYGTAICSNRESIINVQPKIGIGPMKQKAKTLTKRGIGTQLTPSMG